MQQDCANAKAKHGIAMWFALISFFGLIGALVYWSLSLNA